MQAAQLAQQIRQSFRAQALPGLRVAKELADVDQDGIQQGCFFSRVSLQQCGVGRVVRQTQLRHALADATLKRSWLVAAQVEPVRD